MVFGNFVVYFQRSNINIDDVITGIGQSQAILHIATMADSDSVSDIGTYDGWFSSIILLFKISVL